ncbi:unnamed protein product, partial [Polarella glacialis]
MPAVPSAGCSRAGQQPQAQPWEFRSDGCDRSELEIPGGGLKAVVADLGDLDRCLALVSQVFNVNTDDPDEYEGVKRGIATRLGARRSMVGANAATPRPRIRRPVPHGSTERPDVGLVLALESTSAERQPFAGLVDLSLWPDDGRVRAPGARSKPGACSKPYVLNLCIDPAYRRRGLARALMALCERVVRDVWVDSVMLLHVEDDKVPANTMYENMNYSPVKYTFDQEFPYSKAEAK